MRQRSKQRTKGLRIEDQRKTKDRGVTSWEVGGEAQKRKGRFVRLEGEHAREMAARERAKRAVKVRCSWRVAPAAPVARGGVGRR